MNEGGDEVRAHRRRSPSRSDDEVRDDVLHPLEGLMTPAAPLRTSCTPRLRPEGVSAITSFVKMGRASSKRLPSSHRPQPADQIGTFSLRSTDACT